MEQTEKWRNMKIETSSFIVYFEGNIDIKDNWQIEVRSGNSFLPVRNYGIAANNIFFPNAVARFFNKGLYNNILSVSVLYQLKLKKKSE
jgi:hypothetical protein